MIKEYLNVSQSLDYLEKLTGYKYNLDDLRELTIRKQLDICFYSFCTIYKTERSSDPKKESEMIRSVRIGEGVFSPLANRPMQSFNNDGYSFTGVVKVIELLQNIDNVFTPEYADYGYENGEVYYISIPIDGYMTAILKGEKGKGGLIDFTKRLKQSLINFIPINDIRFIRTQLYNVSKDSNKSYIIESVKDSDELVDKTHQIDYLTNELSQAKAIIKQQKAEIEALQQTKTRPPNDELHPKSRSAIRNLLNVLFYQARLDIDAHMGATNAQIVKLASDLSTPITKKTVSYWIKEVQQLRIDVKSEK